MTEPRSDTEIRADLATITAGISFRGAFGTTQAAHRLLDDVAPLLDALSAALAAKEAAEAETERLQAICDQDWFSLDDFMKERAGGRGHSRAHPVAFR